MALTARQIRYLFAVGAFKRSSGGKGGKGGVVYTRDAAERRANTRGRRIAKGREIAEREGMAYTRRNLPKLAGDKTTHSGKTLARVKSGGIERTKDPQKRFDKVRDVTTTTAIFKRKWTNRASERRPLRQALTKADRDNTRPARVSAGKRALSSFGQSKRGKEISAAIGKIDSNNRKIDANLNVGGNYSASTVQKLARRNRDIASRSGLNSRQVSKLLKRLSR